MRGALVPAAARNLWWRWHPRAERVRSVLETGVIAPEFASRVDLRARLRQLDAWSAGGAREDAAAHAARALVHPYGISGTERYFRVAAWHGVQPRSPFDDRDVIDLCVNLPDAQRIRDGWPKAVLREAMRGRLLESVRLRQGKQHLGWSVTRWLLPDAAHLRASLMGRQSLLAPYVDARHLQRALDRATHGDDESLSFVLNAECLGNWLEHVHGQQDRRVLFQEYMPMLARADGSAPA